MTTEEKMEVVGKYRDNLKMLFDIVEAAGENYYRNSYNMEIKACLEDVTERLKGMIVQVAYDFAENEMLDEKNQQGKLGYSFTWLTKLKSAANNDEREKILKDWLKEISEKKSAEVAME